MRVKRIERIFFESVLGAIVGSVTGAIAGPPGILAGAVIGAFIGLLAGVVGEQEDRRSALKERRLDAEIGVIADYRAGRLGGRAWVRHFTPMPQGRASW